MGYTKVGYTKDDSLYLQFFSDEKIVNIYKQLAKSGHKKVANMIIHELVSLTLSDINRTPPSDTTKMFLLASIASLLKERIITKEQVSNNVTDTDLAKIVELQGAGK